MKLIKLVSKIKILELPIALNQADIRNDLKSCTPGEWAIFQLNQGVQNYIGFANPFAENKKILRLVKEVKSDVSEMEDEDVIKNILEEYMAEAFKKRDFYKGIIGVCCRMFYGDQDGLPGLIIDRYCNAIVLQINTAGIDRYEKIVSNYLKKYFNLPILYFENSFLRKIESLPSFLRSSEKLQFLEVNDNQVIIRIPIVDLQKAGFYFDHSYNRLKFLHLLRDLKLGDLQVLDLFCYAGAWGMGLLKHDCARYVHFVDQGDFDKTLIDTANLNSISKEKYEFKRMDVFEFFENNTDKYDVVICDPPAFAKDTNKIPQALEGYRKLFFQCLAHVKKNGFMVAASCTHGVSLEELSKLIGFEAIRANRTLAILDLGTQRIDHPISSLSGSAFYLKYICYHITN
ncbi:MAG: hypothetical protein HYV97_14215 [Bdellovibrio sp.]|nr:hypothetical protein [Bdellovibrio sp.]